VLKLRCDVRDGREAVSVRVQSVEYYSFFTATSYLEAVTFHELLPSRIASLTNNSPYLTALALHPTWHG
jgi:hypothetical protein